MTYAEALAYIASLQPRGWRLGLDRMTEFVKRAGLASTVDGSERRYIHVAGTNGKGSTTAYLQSILVESGVPTGAFFSPYVLDPGERIQIGRSPLVPALFAELTVELKAVADSMEGTEFAGVTEFEFKTGLGFLAWRRTGCEWVALETGLGGRLDATNVVKPAASVIVSIGLDHQFVLGDSIEAIATEKAGIIKPGVPVILGTMPRAAEDVIVKVAEENQAPVWRFGKEIEWDAERMAVRVLDRWFEGIEPGLHGAWQGHNLSLAVGALVAARAPLSPDAVSNGAELAHAPGRYQTCQRSGKTYILDGAHNADSAVALAQTLAQDFGPDAKFVFVTNILQGHEIEAFFGPLAMRIKEAVIAPIDFHRARPPEETRSALQTLGIKARSASTIEEALSQAGELSDGPIIVTGSFYLVGEMGRLLGAT